MNELTMKSMARLPRLVCSLWVLVAIVMLHTLGNAADFSPKSHFYRVDYLRQQHGGVPVINIIFSAPVSSDLAEKFYKKDYIQHNPNVAPGLDGLQTLIRQMHSSGDPMRAEIKLMNAEDDMGWLLIDWTGGTLPEGTPRLGLSAEVFRVEDGMMAEHWDVLQYERKKR